MKTLRVSPGRHGWQLRVDGQTIAFFPSRQEATATARDMAERDPGLYGHREDQITFSAWLTLAAFAGLAAIGLTAFFIALGQDRGWLRWPDWL